MKRFQSMLLTILMLAALTIPVLGYSDVPSGSPLAEDVTKAAEYHLMQGYSNTRFGYSQSITRAQFAAVLVRMFQWTQSTTTKASFTDVPQSYYWFSSIQTAVAHDVVDAGGKFRPTSPITRQEMSVMLVRALGLKGAAKNAANDTLSFKDVTSDKGYIAVAYAIGMTNGMTATTFAPGARATRAQAAAMLVRIYEKYYHSTDWVHGFYAISSYSQLSLAGQMNAVSAGWSRMTWDGSKAVLSTTSANSNEYCIPSGYNSVTDYLEGKQIPLNLSVFMSTSENLNSLLASSSGRSQAIEQILHELTVTYQMIGKNPYSGVTIDFEGLRSSSKSNYNQFLTELSTKVHTLGKKLYVCVSPVLTTGAYYDGYDYKTIGSVADKVILMAYDYDAGNLNSYVGTTYYKTTASTPIGQVYESLRAITNTSTGVQDLSKIVMGFSCKNIAWKVDSAGKLVSGTPSYPTNATVLKRLSQATTVKGWSSVYQMPYATYKTESDETWFLWYENNQSVKAKLELAKLFGIDCVSVWRLGTIPAYSSWNWQSIL